MGPIQSGPMPVVYNTPVGTAVSNITNYIQNSKTFPMSEQLLKHFFKELKEQNLQDNLPLIRSFISAIPDNKLQAEGWREFLTIVNPAYTYGLFEEISSTSSDEAKIYWASVLKNRVDELPDDKKAKWIAYWEDIIQKYEEGSWSKWYKQTRKRLIDKTTFVGNQTLRVLGVYGGIELYYSYVHPHVQYKDTAKFIYTQATTHAQSGFIFAKNAFNSYLFPDYTEKLRSSCMGMFSRYFSRDAQDYSREVEYVCQKEIVPSEVERMSSQEVSSFFDGQVTNRMLTKVKILKDQICVTDIPEEYENALSNDESKLNKIRSAVTTCQSSKNCAKELGKTIADIIGIKIPEPTPQNPNILPLQDLDKVTWLLQQRCMQTGCQKNQLINDFPHVINSFQAPPTPTNDGKFQELGKLFLTARSAFDNCDKIRSDYKIYAAEKLNTTATQQLNTTETQQDEGGLTESNSSFGLGSVFLVACVVGGIALAVFLGKKYRSSQQVQQQPSQNSSSNSNSSQQPNPNPNALSNLNQNQQVVNPNPNSNSNQSSNSNQNPSNQTQSINSNQSQQVVNPNPNSNSNQSSNSNQNQQAVNPNPNSKSTWWNGF